MKRNDTPQEEAAAATQLLQKRKLRAEATRKLEVDLENAREPLARPETPEAVEEYWAAFRGKVEALAEAIGLAQQSFVPVSSAKKVIGEMRGQVAAAEAAENLEALLGTKACGLAVLKVRIPWEFEMSDRPIAICSPMFA